MHDKKSIPTKYTYIPTCICRQHVFVFIVRHQKITGNYKPKKRRKEKQHTDTETELVFSLAHPQYSTIAFQFLLSFLLRVETNVLLLGA